MLGLGRNPTDFIIFTWAGREEEGIDVERGRLAGLGSRRPAAECGLAEFASIGPGYTFDCLSIYSPLEISVHSGGLSSCDTEASMYEDMRTKKMHQNYSIRIGSPIRTPPPITRHETGK
jgi:hypothetical protein